MEEQSQPGHELKNVGVEEHNTNNKGIFIETVALNRSPRRTSNDIREQSYRPNSFNMEFSSTGSKLEQLLTADRKPRRESVGIDGNGNGKLQGDDGASSETFSDKLKKSYAPNLLMSSMQIDPVKSKQLSIETEDNSGNLKGVRWRADRKSDDTSNSDIAEASGSKSTACLKVAPIVLKKYYPSAVRSAECEEFLVSLSEDDQEENSRQQEFESVKDTDDASGTTILKKNDDDHMKAEIEKLLNSPSPTKNWRKPIRQRKFQCSNCSKSYSTEDDLKSHELSHTNDDAKIFQCKNCDKKFRWVASLKVHTRKFHSNKGGRTNDTESSTEQEDSPKKESPPEKKTPSRKAYKSSKSKESPNVQTKLSDESRRVSDTPEEQSNDQSRIRPPRQVKPVVTEKSAANIKKDKKATEAKKAATVEETDEIFRDVGTGRASLRRNIQRPKWLTDTDLVTDYEFPRGTNPIRTGSTTNSPSSTNVSSTSAANGNQNVTRTSNETGKETSRKGYKSKPIPPRQRNNISSLERPKQTKTTEKKSKNLSNNKTKVKEKEKSKKPSQKNKPVPIAKGKTELTPTEELVEGESPTKQLSTKILELSLDDTAESPSLTPTPKSSRKRPTKDAIGEDTEDNIKALMRPKRKKGDNIHDSQPNVIEMAEKDSKDFERTQSTVDDTSGNTTQDNINSTENSEIISQDQNIDVTLNSELGSVEKEEEKTEQNSDFTDSKKIEEATVISIAITDVCGEPTRTLSTDEKPISCQKENLHENISESATTEEYDEQDRNKPQIDPPLADTFPLNSELTRVNERERNESETSEEDQTQRPFGDYQGITFGDIARTGILPFGNDQRKQNADLVEVDKPPCIPTVNDEEMPILKPETAGSTPDCRSNSDSERLKSIDEEISSSSNHSAIPQAPVLSKETMFSSGARHPPRNQESADLDELPLIEDNFIGPLNRRDRSDSLSMRSCGSGSQSEKIKGLEDAKDKDTSAVVSENECIVDSDSNDSLMSEFSELAMQVVEKTDGIQFKEDVLRFITTKVSANSMWAIRKELKRLKKEKNYFKFGKLSPLAAGLMHDIFCQSLH